ncbi:2-methylisocitrate lyase-like PEP mutase family enzyme [Nocardiopsis arvandica]|uniref:2-methylisocitrate lyase-like PEP mutase family enzyme n=1 Tax=Nocardiopsis sinuspersici TaxID=501010 RepID=A0A7Y9XJL8_9ACTN|nr:isocitrate lyase/phosphoenolpyruvate mutase family protein [Nocardiopsis sinuspersici]NYH55708.1 2-methylisocitrate lyase-like PEP mutase family enzyme [Nocardiopsis sinuspersici]
MTSPAECAGGHTGVRAARHDSGRIPPGRPRTDRSPEEPAPGERFRALHLEGDPLLLPNAWDHASAAALAAAGFRAVGTTSLGVAAAAGLPDGQGHTREETLRLARGLSRLDVLVSVDVEGGFGGSPAQVAALAAELERTGIAGINLEDGLPDGGLADVGRQQEVVRAVGEAAPSLFLNARTDTWWLPGHTGQTADRAAAYEEAGADGVFVPGLRDEEEIAALSGALRVPLNILHSPTGPPPRVLAELGVRRVSCGSLLFRAALAGALAAAEAVASGLPLPEGVPGYDEVQALAERFAAPRGRPAAG